MTWQDVCNSVEICDQNLLSRAGDPSIVNKSEEQLSTVWDFILEHATWPVWASAKLPENLTSWLWTKCGLLQNDRQNRGSYGIVIFLLIIITVLKFHKISTIKGCICGSLGWNCKVPPNKLTAACSTEMVTTPEFPTNVAMPIKLKVTYRLGKICTLLGTNTSIHIPSKPSLLSRWFSFSQGGIY